MADFILLKAQWLEQLCGPGENSVRNQVIRACRDAAFFSTVNELRRRAPKERQPNAQWMEMFVLGYAIRQVATIRRLVDPRRDVSSLRRVVDSMITNRKLLTRENVVGYDGTPIDSALAWKTYEASIDLDEANRTGQGGDALLLQRWSDSDFRNKSFDRIADFGEDGVRNARDRVSKLLLERMRNSMDIAAVIRTKNFVNNYVAHASARVDPNDTETRPTFNDIETSLRTLTHLHAFLLGPVLYHLSGTVVPVPQYDNLVNLDLAMIDSDQMNVARAVWREKSAAIDAWANDGDTRASIAALSRHHRKASPAGAL